MRLIIDGTPTQFDENDTILSAMLKSGQHPTGGGALCCGGDCSHCLATVDGVSYIRTCQVKPRAGMVIKRDHQGGVYPPLPKEGRLREEVDSRNLHCDVCVIGQGESGQAAAEEARTAGKKVITLDSRNGEDAVAIYAGPKVIARTDAGMLYIHVKDEIVVATGAAEIQPAVPGSNLDGLMTARAAEELHHAGLDLGNVVSVGSAPEGIHTTVAEGELLRFEGENGQITAVIMVDAAGNETAYPCDTATLALGLHPRNALHKMGADLPVRAVGEATIESTIPKVPEAGFICPCAGIGRKELEFTWESGFQEMELIKRSTLAGTGTCQGMCCIPYMRSFIQEKGGELQERFTARPVNRQLTLGEISAGAHHHPTAKTALDHVHRELGAQMERSGGWWRPWNYGKLQEEYWSVREGVSLMDVSTLGKMLVSGPDALEFLERIYPTKVSTIKTGRTRYVLLLNERGYVMDDGLIGKMSDTR
ncbi:MAG: 2Fe-2S iron-sulfur cluster-binding protein, partial [Chloroflexota bacterium]